MKVTQIDYSAIINANASKFSAKQTEIGLKKQKSALDSYASSQQALTTANISQSILNFANSLGKVYETYKKSQEELDIQEANSLLTEIAATANANIKKIISDGGQIVRFDNNGTAVFTDEFENYIQTEKQKIIDLNIDQKIKDNALASFNEFETAARGQYLDDLYQRNIDAIQTARQNQISEASLLDSSVSGMYDTGFSLIDTWTDLSDIERENLKYAYKKNVDNTNRTNTVITLARDKGLDDALSYIRGLTGITEEDRLALESQAYSTNNNEIQKQNIIVSNAFSQRLQNGEFPADIRKEMQPLLDAMDNDRKTEIEKSIDLIQMQYVQNNLPKFNMDTSSSATLIGYKNSISPGGKFDYLFKGIEEYQDSLILDVQDKISQRQALETKAIEETEKEKLEYTKNYINGLEKMVQNGEISGQQAISMAKNLALQTSSYNDDLLVEDMVKNISQIVPSQYKNLVDDFLKNFEASYRNYIGLDNKEFSADVLFAVNSARGELIDLFYQTATNEITPDQIKLRMENINQGYMGKIIDKLAGISLPEETLIREGVFNINTSDLSKTINLLSQNASSIYKDSEGMIKFRNQQTQISYQKVMEAGLFVLDKLGIQTNFVKPLQTAEDLIPIPTFITIDGQTYTLDAQNNLLEMKDGKWEAFKNVADILNPQKEKNTQNSNGYPAAYLSGNLQKNNKIPTSAAASAML